MISLLKVELFDSLTYNYIFLKDSSMRSNRKEGLLDKKINKCL